MEFKKVDLNNNTETKKEDISAGAGGKTRKLPKIKLPKFKFGAPSGKKVVGILVIIAILAGIAGFFLILPAKAIYEQGRKAENQARATYDAVKTQNIQLAQEELKKMHSDLTELDRAVDRLSWIDPLPVIGVYRKDVKHAVTAGIAGAEAGQIAVAAIEPYSDLLGLEGGSKFVEKSTEERLETAVATLDKLTPKLGDIAQKLETVKSEIDQINPEDYPEELRDIQVRELITRYQDQLDKTAGLFIEARPFLEAFPELVGAKEPKTYLILFQNDKELRPTGGFITAYAIFRLDKGKIEVLRSDDIYNLDNARSRRIGAPDEILKYHKGVYYFNLRDSNLSPDFKLSMQQFEELYEDVGGRVEVDGIVGVDTHVLVEAMKILGPIQAYRTTFTTEPDERCGGCPQVVYELEEYADRRVGYIRENRKDIIGVLLLQIMQKSLGVSPGQYWGRLFQMALDEIQQKHILAYFHDPKAQKGAEALNLAGRIREYEADYLHINDTNFAGAKSNMFTNHTVTQSINVSEDGSVTKTLQLKYKNTEPASPGCNLERGGICLNGLLRNWVRVYVPEGAELLSFKGSETDPVTKKELGKTVFEGFFTVRPEGQAIVELSYKLPLKANESKYKLLIQKQPGTQGHEYVINMNGEQKEEFNLMTDKELLFEL